MYQPIDVRPGQSGLEDFPELIMRARQQQAAREAQRANTLLQGKQFDAENQFRSQQLAMQNQDRQARLGMDQQEFGLKQAKEQLLAKQQITQALDAGRPDLAKQIADTYKIPLTEVPGQNPQDTLMKPSQFQRQAPEEGPQASPEDLRRAAVIRGEQDSFDPSVQAKRPSEYRAEAEAEGQRFAAAQQPVAPVPQMPMDVKSAKWSIAGAEYDPEEVKRSQAAKIEANANRFSGAMGGIEGMGKYIPVYQAGVAAGLTPEKSFELMQKRMESDEAREERSEDKRLGREVSIENNKRIAAAMGARAGANVPYQEANKDRGEEQAIDAITKNVLTTTGYKEQALANRRFNDMAFKLSKGNAAIDAAIIGEWVKQAQGGTGVLSDADIKTFYTRIGGWGIRTEEEIQGAINGKMGAEKRKLMLTAVKELAGRAATNMNEVKESLRFRLQDSAFAHRTDSALGTYFPEERSKIEDARAIDKARQARKNNTRAGRIKGGGRDRLDEDLDGF
jgi:hypothetical protein